MNECITMRSLGKNGRFGNQIFQYAFLRYYARKHGLDYQVPAWIGQRLFGLNDPPISNVFSKCKVARKDDLDMVCYKSPLVNVDFEGFFHELEYYSDDKKFFRNLFVPTKGLQNYLEKCWGNTKGRDIIGVHLRFGDYGFSYFFETPLQWIIDELEKRWHMYNAPLLYLATDDVRVRHTFKKFSPVLQADVFPDVQLQNCPAFYADFWALSQVNTLLIIANSSFSFSSALLNQNCNEMLRPDLEAQRLVRFNPWNSSSVVLKTTTPFLNFLARYPRVRKYYTKIRRFYLFYIKPMFFM